MFRPYPIVSSAALLLSVGCADPDSVQPSGPTTATTTSTTSTSTGGSGGSGGSGTGAGGLASVGGGGAGGSAVVYPMAVGAAYPNGGDSRVVLIDSSGMRTALHNPTSGMFESADDIDELEGGIPLLDVVAAANVGDEVYFFDATGQVTVYDRQQATFSTPEPVGDLLTDVPFATIGAAFGSSANLFVFSQGGTSYAAFNTATETWSPIYSFTADFGGGGAPIANVGAAYFDGNGAYVLFDNSGTSYCIYSGGGQFSDDFDIDQLGDGMLTFNDE